MKINQLSWTSLQGCVSQNSFKQVPEQAKVCSSEVHGCDSTFCLAPFSQCPEFHFHMATAAKATPRFNMPDQFFHVCKYEVQQSFPPHWLFNRMLGSCHPYTPETSWTACALLCCPSYLELYTLIELHRVYSKALQSPGIQKGTTDCKGLHSVYNITDKRDIHKIQTYIFYPVNT